MTSTTTQPRDRAYWTTVIHNAAQVKPDEPRYGEARQVIQMGLEGLQNLADSASEQDVKAPGKLGTAMVNFGQGASLGAATEYSNAVDRHPILGPLVRAVTGNASTPGTHEAYLQASKEANPKTAFVADLAGTAATGAILSPAVAGAGPVLGTAILGGTTEGFRGAVEPFPGMTRGESAAIRGASGAIGGAVIGKFAKVLAPGVRAIVGNVLKMMGRNAPAEAVEQITESAIRTQLAKMKVAPEVVDRAVASWKANGTMSVRPPEVLARPGETITQVAPKGFEVSGERATPPAPVNGSFWEQIHGPSVRDLGKGQTLPYYPRGGAVEQSMAPFPARSASVSPTPDAVTEKQLPMMLEWLKGAPAGEESARIATLRALGVPLGPTAETDLLQFLGRTPQ